MLWKRLTAPGTPDPLNWSGRSMINTAQWIGVSHGAGEYVTVSRFGGLSQVYSADAWQSLFGLGAVANPFLAGAFGNGRHVFVGANQSYGVRLTGAAWQQKTFTPAEAGDISGIVYGQGTFVAVDSDLTPKVLRSPDGDAWASSSSAGVRAASVCHNGSNKFVGLARNGQTISSVDSGVSWVAQPSFDPSSNWISIAFSAGKYVAISSDTASTATSTDGETWALNAGVLPSGIGWRKITSGAGRFCIVGPGTNIALISDDGENWETSYLPFVADWWDVGYGSDGFMAVQNGGSSSAILQVP
jgi:hypothetical protein